MQSLPVAGAADELVAAEMILVEAGPLDLRAHRAVEDEDALPSGCLERGKDFGTVRPSGDRAQQFVQQ